MPRSRRRRGGRHVVTVAQSVPAGARGRLAIKRRQIAARIRNHVSIVVVVDQWCPRHFAINGDAIAGGVRWIELLGERAGDASLRFVTRFPARTLAEADDEAMGAPLEELDASLEPGAAGEIVMESKNRSSTFTSGAAKPQTVSKGLSASMMKS